MTKVQNPIIGRAKGSAGGMTFSKNSDQNVMRAKAFEVNNPKTTAQTTQRDYFKDLTSLVSTFSPEQLRTLFPNKPKKMSRRNALTRQLSEDVTIAGTTKSIDFAEINTLGNAPTMNFGTTTIEKSNGEMSVNIDPIVIDNTDFRYFYFIVAFVNETKGDIYLPLNSIEVRQGVLDVTIPASWTESDTIHAIPLITDSKVDVSTRGFGSFIIKTRPEKK